MHDQAAAWRHSVRGCLNGLKLCTAALEFRLPREEAIDFLSSLEKTSEEMIRLMDQGEAFNIPDPERASPAELTAVPQK